MIHSLKCSLKNLNHVYKDKVRRGTVNGKDALMKSVTGVIDHPAFYYAIIPEGYQLIETETEYVGVLDEQTGDSRDLKWELIPGDAQVTIQTEIL